MKIFSEQTAPQFQVSIKKTIVLQRICSENVLENTSG